MQLTWIVFNNNIETSGNRYFSDVASVRYCLIIPARALQRMNYGINLVIAER